MSADNYFLIKQHGGRWCLYHRFASAEEDGQYTTDNPGVLWSIHLTLKEAVKAAQVEYTEYGYRIEFPDETKKGGLDEV